MTAAMHSAAEAAYVPAPSLAEMNLGLARQAGDWARRSHCPACLAKKIRRFALVRSIQYDRCAQCGFVFANPVPPETVLAAFYNSPFYNNYRVLEDELIGGEPYFSISAYRDLRELAGWVEVDQGAAILDFGCGPGSFLALLRDEFGYRNVEGLELNQLSAEVAIARHGLKLASEPSGLSRRHYDLIVLLETIEHVPNPDEVVALCADLLSPGGVLFVTTPSVQNPPARWFPSHCVHYTGPSHISMFTEPALTTLLARHGLTVTRLETDLTIQVFGYWLSSPFYALDFASPLSAGDRDDPLFRPTAFGKALGLAPKRRPGFLLNQALRLDRLLGRAWAGLSRQTYSNHLYAMARKTS